MRVRPGYVVRVRPADVGSRVSVRTISGERYRDVVGELLSWADGILRIRRRDGSIVDVAENLVVAGKVVPPGPPRRARGARAGITQARLQSTGTAATGIGDLALEEIAGRGWQGFESSWLGRWLLRASAGFTGRANSVLPLGDPGLPLAAALGRASRWYADRGLPVRFQVPLPARADLDGALAELGWTTSDRNHVLTAPVSAVLAAVPDRDDAPPVVVETAPSPQWLRLYRFRGGPPPAAAPRQLVQADRPVFLSIRDGDEPLAIARGALAAGWLGITAVEVAESARRRGLGSHIVRELCAWAAMAGPEPAHSVYLQVQTGNAAALALYDRLGFTRHHDYQYRLAPGVMAR
ncbi:MAG: GNAT family N-acetyltransferase [Actinomycetes bacterium]